MGARLLHWWVMIGWLKLITVGVLLYSGATQLITYDTWWFSHSVNLVFHEAGHVFLLFFGQYLFALGGTLFEIGVPLLVWWQFVRQRDWFAASCVSWWSATAWLSVSIYASDATARALPLITGDPATHDWHYLLGEIGWLAYDTEVGWMFLGGAWMWLGVCVWCAWRDTDIALVRHRVGL